jgi:myo-inositol-1(or 4)-monophosphatase
VTPAVDVAELERVAVEAARRGGEVLRARFRETLRVESKSLHDFVTDVDRAAEEVVLAHLREAFPGHAVMAEEGAPDTERAEYRWIVDPLDGTTNFIHGVPVFAVSVAVEDARGLAAGAVLDPTQDEMFRAARGRGAFVNDEPMRVSEPDGLAAAVLATGFPFRGFEKIDGYLAVLRHFMTRTSGIRRAGSAAIDLAYTACGRYDGFWETGLSAWDMAAGALLIREAGGRVGDFDGGDRFLETGEIVAAGPTLYPQLLDATRTHLL